MNIEKLFLVHAATTNFAQYQLMKLVINDLRTTDLTGTFTFSKAVNRKVSVDQNFCQYVACYYASNLWVGLVQNVNYDEKDAEIIFLHP